QGAQVGVAAATVGRPDAATTIPPMTSLSWPQVRAWRLARQHLLDGSTASTVEEAASSSLGVHAQVSSCAEQAVAIRVPGAGPEDVRAALWDRRTLVRLWAMRGTIHLFTAA